MPAVSQAVRFREWRSRFVLLFESSIHKRQKRSGWTGSIPLRCAAPAEPTINKSMCLRTRICMHLYIHKRRNKRLVSVLAGESPRAQHHSPQLFAYSQTTKKFVSVAAARCSNYRQTQPFEFSSHSKVRSMKTRRGTCLMFACVFANTIVIFCGAKESDPPPCTLSKGLVRNWTWDYFSPAPDGFLSRKLWVIWLDIFHISAIYPVYVSL